MLSFPWNASLIRCCGKVWDFGIRSVKRGCQAHSRASWHAKKRIGKISRMQELWTSVLPTLLLRTHTSTDMMPTAR